MKVHAPVYQSYWQGTEVDLSARQELLFILHDQLNVEVFPREVWQRSPVIVFVESFAYASFLPHHQMKLAFILSCQRHYAIELLQQGYEVITITTAGFHSDGLQELLTGFPHLSLSYMQPNEWQTRMKMDELKNKFPQRVRSFPNNFFLANVEEFRHRINRYYRLENFYRDMRRQTGYLMEGGQPTGGKWNYDKDNRKPLPKNISIPQLPTFAPDPVTQEVIDQVKTFFSHHFGKLDRFLWAVTRTQALQLAAEFMDRRLVNFGPYEDAIKTGEPFLFHSVLSPYLNNGLLLPAELCDMAIDRYERGTAPLNSVEGFIRQIIGWREYIRVYYEARMPEVRNANHFGFTYTLPQLFWDGKTELKCLADAMQNVINWGYSHHIQRLMVLSNFSNLTLTSPIELHHWFWLAYVDAYEWVELPNVLGMSTYADGGILATKPYVAGGNYINKMSDCCRQCAYDVKQKVGAKACPFNYLYWHFVDRFRNDFMENGRVSLMVSMYDQKSMAEKQEIHRSASEFIQRLPRYKTLLQGVKI